MGKKRELSEDVRSRIVNSHTNNMSYKATSNQFMVPVSPIQSIINTLMKCHNVKNHNERSRKPKISPRLARKVLLEANSDPRITTQVNLQNLSNSGTQISRQILQRTLHKHGLTGCRSRKTPPLHPSKPAQLLPKHGSKDGSFWAQGRGLFLAKKGRCIQPKKLVQAVKYGGGSKTLWGYFSASGPRNLVKVEGIMKQNQYIKILNINAKQSAVKFVLPNNGSSNTTTIRSIWQNLSRRGLWIMMGLVWSGQVRAPTSILLKTCGDYS